MKINSEPAFACNCICIYEDVTQLQYMYVNNDSIISTDKLTKWLVRLVRPGCIRDTSMTSGDAIAIEFQISFPRYSVPEPQPLAIVLYVFVSIFCVSSRFCSNSFRLSGSWITFVRQIGMYCRFLFLLLHRFRICLSDYIYRSDCGSTIGFLHFPGTEKNISMADK